MINRNGNVVMLYTDNVQNFIICFLNFKNH